MKYFSFINDKVIQTRKLLFKKIMIILLAQSQFISAGLSSRRSSYSTQMQWGTSQIQKVAGSRQDSTHSMHGKPVHEGIF